MCESCETLRGALQASDAQVRRLRSQLADARKSELMARQDAARAVSMVKSPDANLRAMVAELAEAHAVLGEAHRRIAAEFEALRAMVEG